MFTIGIRKGDFSLRYQIKNGTRTRVNREYHTHDDVYQKDSLRNGFWKLKVGIYPVVEGLVGLHDIIIFQRVADVSMIIIAFEIQMYLLSRSVASGHHPLINKVNLIIPIFIYCLPYLFSNVIASFNVMFIFPCRNIIK